MSYLIDTNVVIYYFNGLTDDEDLHELLKKDFRISIITKIEFLGWSEFGVNRPLYNQAKAFIRHATVYDLTARVAEQTIQLRQQYRIKTPDAIIAATALLNRLTVVTHNTNDFKHLGAKTLSVIMKSNS